MTEPSQVRRLLDSAGTQLACRVIAELKGNIGLQSVTVNVTIDDVSATSTGS